MVLGFERMLAKCIRKETFRGQTLHFLPLFLSPSLPLSLPLSSSILLSGAATNDACRMFICECDKHLAECMSTAPYIAAHDHYDQSLCHQQS